MRDRLSPSSIADSKIRNVKTAQKAVTLWLTSVICRITQRLCAVIRPSREFALSRTRLDYVGLLQSDFSNLLLRALPNEAFDSLAPVMQRVDLPLKFVLVEPNVLNDLICFLESIPSSLVATSSDHEIVEVGHIRYEGMSRMHLLLKVSKTPNKTFMQAAGRGICVPTSAFLSVVEQVRAANDLLLRYVHCCE